MPSIKPRRVDPKVFDKRDLSSREQLATRLLSVAEGAEACHPATAIVPANAPAVPDAAPSGAGDALSRKRPSPLKNPLGDPR